MIPCAIYTRKSSEEGLEQGFNSLDAQREASEAYILSQKSQGWKALPKLYDDGGYSGGNTQRPALQALLADVASGKVKVVIVYKVDRLTRSLADFAKLVELFDAHGVSFVSVTQQFNTTNSMGRLTLNVLLSFAQFEREVTGERIRDKIAASKRKGMWMGGTPPVGYLPNGRTLEIDEPQAQRIREIFRLYLELGNVTRLRAELQRRGWLTPQRVSRRLNGSGGRPFSRGHLYRILGNRIYIGQIPHRGQSYPGEHRAIVDQATWDAVQAAVASNIQGPRIRANVKDPSLLAGLLFTGSGERFTASHTTKGSKRYRYYATTTEQPTRLPAREVEQAVILGVMGFLRDEAALLDRVTGLVPKTLALAAAAAVRLELTGNALTEIVREVRVGDAGLAITLRKELLELDDDLSFSVPCRLKRCGRAMRLVVQPQGVKVAVIDQALVGLVAKGQEWFKRLAGRKAASPKEISKQDGCASSYVSRLIWMAFLAPDIVEKIGRGQQPPDLTAGRLKAMVPLPMGWQEQRVLLGMVE